MDGRGLGVVMAYSFCCAPLHAVRHFAQPPQGAERFRIVWPGWGQPHRIVVAANLTGKFSSPIALGGYRPQWCQVAGKRPRNAAERVGDAYATTAAEGLGNRLFWILDPRLARAIRRLRWFQRRGRNDRRRYRAGGRYPRPLRARSPPLRHLPGPANRTWFRAGCFRE